MSGLSPTWGKTLQSLKDVLNNKSLLFIDQEVILNQSHVQQAVPSMFMSYIKGPKINWTVNNSLFIGF